MKRGNLHRQASGCEQIQKLKMRNPCLQKWQIRVTMCRIIKVFKWKGATCINPHASRSFQKFEHIRGRLQQQQVVNGGEEIKTKLPRSSTQFCRCCYKVMNQGLGENANYLFSHLSLRAHCHGFKVFSNVHVWLDSLSGNIFVALFFSSCSFFKDFHITFM